MKWLAEHGTLEGVLGAADTIQPERFREQLRAEAERIRGNLRLVTFHTEFDLDLGLPAVEDVSAVEQFLVEMEMHSTLRRYLARHGRSSESDHPAPSEEKPKSGSRAPASPSGPTQGELF